MNEKVTYIKLVVRDSVIQQLFKSTLKIKLQGLSKQIHLVGERFILKTHQNATNISYFVDVSVSIIDERSYQLNQTYDCFLGMPSLCCVKNRKNCIIRVTVSLKSVHCQ